MEITIVQVFAKTARLLQRLPLVAVLELPYLLQMLTVLGLTSWVTVQYRQITVADLATSLREETTDRVLAYVDHQLSGAARLNASHVAAVETGLLDLNDFEQMGRFFWQQMQIYPVDYLNYGNQAGEFIGVERLDNGTLVINETRRDNLKQMTIYQTDAEGHRTQVEAIDPADPIQSEAWYAEAAVAGHPLWSPVYAWDDQPNVLSISASQPLYDAQGQLMGVMGTDLLLTHISQFLSTVHVSPSTQIFIVEPSGLLVASSDGHPPYTVVDGQAQRQLATQSANPLVRATAERLIQGRLLETAASATMTLRLGSGRQFVSVTPWQDDLGLDWVVVVVVPEADFLSQADAFARTTLLLALLSVAVAVLLALLTDRWINRPIANLAQASRAIAHGDRTQTVEVQGIRELKTLASAFNQMAAQVADTFAQLENRVTQRTAELATAKVAAEAANQSKNVFLANMSHQLRTPLNIVLGFIQVMQKDAALSAQHQASLTSMRHSADYLLAQINNLLLASKLDGEGQLAATPSWFDLGELLQDLQTQFSAWRGQPAVALRFDLQVPIPQLVYTDETKLRQILLNLLENAFKFTTAGQVTLRLVGQPQHSGPTDDLSPVALPEATGDYTLTFTVTDTGPGIDCHDLGRLFCPFEQLEPGQRSQRGSGLGLFICQEYVRLLGGELCCHSHPGEGSCFHFDLEVKGSCQTLTYHFPTADNSSTLAATSPPEAEHLMALPSTWRERLRVAAAKGDDRAILTLLEDLPTEDAALGDWLHHWAINYQFDLILELIEGATPDA
ncbi:sensor histidine kinase [Nodosilinea sp. E11]|uniref:sensor histidine kinase n=1 Tax=Nodosilinea sp. E11 TaxID=3037479 RepID=UPI002934683E|nr:sensor histidine kinase [Nodosilinea sp. E11]WOD40316.1 sensor histidine kinase [Nodosilinea sp. E11]